MPIIITGGESRNMRMMAIMMIGSVRRDGDEDDETL